MPQPTRPDRRALAVLAGLIVPALAALVLAGSSGDAGPALGRADFSDRREPPPWRVLTGEPLREFDLGQLVFNTPWVVAGKPGSARIDGLGPLFVSSSCDACHNNGARGRPPEGIGGLSNSFVMQLDGPTEGPYGAVLNTAAIADHAPEGHVGVQWRSIEGRYADGGYWTLREPRYRLRKLLYGPPASGTVLRPRIAPPVFGAGLLERVSPQTLRELRARQPRGQRGTLPGGRFGWRGDAIDLEDQSARAFAREMGLTSSARPQDDCSVTQVACRAAAMTDDGLPEVSDEFMRAVVRWQRELAVPSRTALAPQRETAGRQLFESTGCATCHVPSLPVEIDDIAGRIEAYSDLLLHDLGDGLADRTYADRPVKTLWRTAPLWGMAHAGRFGRIALLHDGRAASVEEAILWHRGQAEGARSAFLRLDTGARQLLSEWVGSL